MAGPFHPAACKAWAHVAAQLHQLIVRVPSLGLLLDKLLLQELAFGHKVALAGLEQQLVLACPRWTIPCCLPLLQDSRCRVLGLLQLLHQLLPLCAQLPHMDPQSVPFCLQSSDLVEGVQVREALLREVELAIFGNAEVDAACRSARCLEQASQRRGEGRPALAWRRLYLLDRRRHGALCEAEGVVTGGWWCEGLRSAHTLTRPSRNRSSFSAQIDDGRGRGAADQAGGGRGR
jgi:hypothetical protein